MTLLAFALLLPSSTWLLGCLFGLLDHRDPVATLRLAAVRVLPFVIAALLLGQRAVVPALAALATALTLYVVWQQGMRTVMQKGWLRGRPED
jgi:hypothetical protein